MSEPNSLTPSLIMLAAVGSFTLIWSMMEMGLEFVALLVFHQLGGKDVEKEAPIKLSRKIDHIRETAKKSDKFKPWAEEAIALMNEIDEQIENRHNLIHGCIHSSGPGEQISFVRIIHDKKGFHTGAEHSVTLEQLRAATASTMTLARKLLELGFKITVAIDPRHEIVDQLRKLLAEDT